MTPQEILQRFYDHDRIDHRAYDVKYRAEDTGTEILREEYVRRGGSVSRADVHYLTEPILLAWLAREALIEIGAATK